MNYYNEADTKNVLPDAISPAYTNGKQGCCAFLVGRLASRHRPTGEHCVKVREAVFRLCQHLDVSKKDQMLLDAAAVLHDIGKLAIPFSILNKEDPLDQIEWSLIEEHPKIGAELINAAFPDIPILSSLVIRHHERLDGSGYPSRLEANSLDDLDRVIPVADVFVALTEHRTYRPALSVLEALEILERTEKGKFDQRVVQALINAVQDSTPPAIVALYDLDMMQSELGKREIRKAS